MYFHASDSALRLTMRRAIKMFLLYCIVLYYIHVRINHSANCAMAWDHPRRKGPPVWMHLTSALAYDVTLFACCELMRRVLLSLLYMMNASSTVLDDLTKHHADCQEPRSAPEPNTRQSSMGYLYLSTVVLQCLQCFDTVGWEAGRASGL